MWPEGLIASFASDVEYSFLSNVRPLGSHGKKREQGCSRYYGSMPRAQSKGCRFEEEEILAQRPPKGRLTGIHFPVAEHVSVPKQPDAEVFRRLWKPPFERFSVKDLSSQAAEIQGNVNAAWVR